MATEPTSPTPARPLPQLFLLRLWCSAQGFRAALRPIGGGEPRMFSELGTLSEFLRRTAQEAPSPDADPSPRPTAGSGGAL